MPGKPLVSVVMPVHDGTEWIAATLESLRAASEDIEIIVVDSSPGPETATIVERFASRLAIKLLRRADLRPWQVKTNVGVELAAADHVCILHQDDLWLHGRVESVRRWISEAPKAILHLAPTLLVDSNGRTVGRWTCPLPPERSLGSQFLLSRLLVQNFVSVPAPVFLRSAWLECGGMDEQLWYTPDWDMWVKLALAGPVVYHDEATTAFRLHGGSLTVTGSRNLADFRLQMQTVLDRHLPALAAQRRKRIERLARASIDVNTSLANASAGNATGLASAAVNLLSLGPSGMKRYLRDSRLRERLVSRLRAKVSGTF